MFKKSKMGRRVRVVFFFPNQLKSVDRNVGQLESAFSISPMRNLLGDTSETLFSIRSEKQDRKNSRLDKAFIHNTQPEWWLSGVRHAPKIEEHYGEETIQFQRWSITVSSSSILQTLCLACLLFSLNKEIKQDRWNRE